LSALASASVLAAPAAATAGWRRFAVVVAPILAIAILQQVVFGAFGDISWLITVCEGWLDGRTPYVDMIETNPPAAILIYMPPVALARLLHLQPEAVVAAYGLLLACGALAYVADALARARLAPADRDGWLRIGAAALLVLPGRTFDERDFFALLFGLPFIALWAARANGARPEIWRVALGGASLAAMIALKPPYGAIALALAPYLISRTGLGRALLAFEAYIAAALLAAYVFGTIHAFPAYFHDVLPTVMQAYIPVRESAVELISNAGVVATLALGGLALGLASSQLAGSRVDSPLVAVPALASLGALAAFFVQGKGWLYHVYPAIALMMLALAGAAPSRAQDGPGWRAAAAIATTTLLFVAAFDLSPLPTAILLALGVHLALPQPIEERRTLRLLLLASGGLIGAACGFYSLSFPGPTRAFVDAVRALGPHPRIATLGEGLGIGFPLTRNVAGVWTMRAQGLLMSAGARRLHDMHPRDLDLADRLDAVIAQDVKTAAEDILREKPDALLISRAGPRFHAWLLAEPSLAAARAHYLFIAGNANPAWPVDLYVREDKVGLRGTAP